MPPEVTPPAEPAVEPPAPDPPPGPKQGEKPPGKTWTDEEVQEHVERKLKGSGKEQKKLQAEVEDLRRWREAKEAESLTESEKQAARISELEKEAALAAELRQEKADRLERLAERNTERIKTLPKDVKNTAKKWEDRMGPDAFAELIDDLERQVEVRDVKHGGKVAPSPEEMTDEQWEDRMKHWGKAITSGQKFEEGKKK
jgi:hypothetical protein